ncbi:MAG: SCO4226 family nickel-binding protein [Planctomycetes bacterium]|nr:SCO4226 family nickel-binding protein [Planctomycetota bacterium]
MAQFMDVHRGMKGLTREQLEEAHQADLRLQAEEGVEFKHAWLDPKQGVAFCLSEGPDAEAVRRVHERAGHPPDEIYELPLEV